MAYDSRTARDEPDALIGYYCQYCRGNGTTVSINRVRYVTVLHAPGCELLLYLRSRHPALVKEADNGSRLSSGGNHPPPTPVAMPFLPSH